MKIWCMACMKDMGNENMIKKGFCIFFFLITLTTGCERELPVLEERFCTDAFLEVYDVPVQLEMNVMTQYQEKVIYREGNWIYAYDQKADTCEKLCQKPGCTHEGIHCNAYNEVSFYGTGMLQVYDGSLYVLDAMGDQWGLYRMDLEGIEKKMVQKLPVNIEQRSVMAWMHRGYVFTYVMEYQKARLYQSILGQEGEDRQIWKEPKNSGSYFRILGDTIYWVTYSTEEISHIELRTYDLTRNQWKTILETDIEGLVGPLWITDQKVYLGNHSLKEEAYKLLPMIWIVRKHS